MNVRNEYMKSVQNPACSDFVTTVIHAQSHTRCKIIMRVQAAVGIKINIRCHT